MEMIIDTLGLLGFLVWPLKWFILKILEIKQPSYEWHGTEINRKKHLKKFPKYITNKILYLTHEDKN